MTETSCHNDLFPLKLSPMEICWLLEDCPSHPMQFFLFLRVSGHLRRPEFEAAVQTALARHPLFSAVVRKISNSRWEWVPGTGEPLEVVWKAGNPEELPAAKPIDIYTERGLRITVIEGAGDSSILLQFQHTVCDGLSASEVAADLLTSYANQVGGKGAPFKYKRIEAEDLKNRGSQVLGKNEKIRWVRDGLFSLVKFHRFYKHRPVMLVDRRPPPDDDPIASPPGAFFCYFSREESAAINQRAKQAQTNLNSLLLANMFTTFADWRVKHEETRSSDLFRVSIPISMREPQHRATSAANMVSLVCFDRLIGESKDRDEILRWLEGEIEKVKTGRWGIILPLTISLLKWWPGQLVAGLRRKRFSGSTLFSNLGPVLTTCHLPKTDGKIAIGDLQVEEVGFLPVLRPGHCATVSACTYGGKITLGMHYDERMISAVDAKALFDNFIERLC